MYLFFGIFFFLLLLFFFINFWRRKKIIKKVCAMSAVEKCSLINDILEPFGFSYLSSQDIFTSRMDAWQRQFGYCALYDETAYRFHLIFDFLPIYFDYNGRTWLIELWKGQYGINTGSEMGVYYADSILKESEYKTTLFKSVADDDMLEFSFNLFRKGMQISDVCARHWWLTAFSMERFSQPADLFMKASIVFPNQEMTSAFVQGLKNAGYHPEDICICYNRVSFSFSGTYKSYGFFRLIRTKLAQGMNLFWCRAYLFVTRPFCLSLDRLLYLYYYLPLIFRKMLRIRKYKKFRIGRRNFG